MTRLEKLYQYHIERDVFCDVIEKTIGYKKLSDAFDGDERI